MSAEEPPAIVIEQVSAMHGHGKQSRTALMPTSLSVRRGESVAVVGRSGAGKSTLADIVLGLRTPAGGSVTVCGEPWCSASRGPSTRLRRLVQGVPQDPGAAFVPRWTIHRSISRALHALGGSRPGGTQRSGPLSTQAVDRLIAEAAECAQLDPGLLHKRLGEVSGGQAQRAALTRALAVGPTVLVADEPTSALDPVTAEAVSSSLLSIVENAGLALLLVTHDPAFAACCTRQVEITAPGHALV